MEEGTLHCSYHGWRFDASGRCTHIPQVSGKAAATACASQNSCVASFPTQARPDNARLQGRNSFSSFWNSLSSVVNGQYRAVHKFNGMPMSQGRK